MVEVAEAGTGTIEDLVKDARTQAEAESPDSAPKKKTTTRKRTSRAKRDLTEPLTELYTTLGMGLFLLSPPDGQLLLEHGANCASALNDLAKQNPNVYAALDKLCTGGAMGAVVMAHAPIVIGIMGNHNLVPDIGKLIGGKTKDADKDSQNSEGENPDYAFGGPPSGNGSAATVGAIPSVPPIIMGAG